MTGISQGPLQAELPQPLSEWPRAKLGWVSTIASGVSSRVDDGDFPVYGANGVIGRTDVAAYKKPCVLVGRVGTAGAVTYADGQFGASDNVLVVSPRSRLNARFLFYSLSAIDFSSYISETAQPLLTGTALKHQSLSLPPVEEQCRIAAFLDHETARIDELVREQEQLIGLINEKRSAYVSHLVTQGQDSSAQKQDSGVELLGDIPSRWEVAKLGRLAVKIGSGKTPRGGATAYVDEGVLFLRSQNVYDDGLRLESVVYIDTDTDEEMRGSRVRPMDVLINITGASIGRATIVPQEFPPANVNQHVAIIRLRQPSELAKWIAVVLQTSYAKTLVQLAMSGAARDGLTSEELAQFRVPVPPTEERKAIIAHLEDLESDWTRLTDTAIQSKRLLLERRSALISAAVTGQLDLREWQPREPEAVAEVA